MAVEAFVSRTTKKACPLTPSNSTSTVTAQHSTGLCSRPTGTTRWWITRAVVFKTSYGVVQQSLFYSPIYAADDVDCMQTNLQRAHELAPFYKY
jgi:hypothetical protein